MNAEELLRNLRQVVAETEHLLAATAGATTDKVKGARARAEDSMRTACKRLQHAEHFIARRIRFGARLVDCHVHAKPWSSMGLAAVAAFAVGCLMARR